MEGFKRKALLQQLFILRDPRNRAPSEQAHYCLGFISAELIGDGVSSEEYQRIFHLIRNAKHCCVTRKPWPESKDFAPF
jgi:hypothetical protein